MVGVSDQDRTASKPLDRQPSVVLPDKIMGLVGAGVATPDLVSTPVARLARLDRQPGEERRQKVAAQVRRARTTFGIPEGQEPIGEQVEQAQAEMMAEALKPLHDPKLRDLLVNPKRSLEQVIDEVTQDELIQAGFDTNVIALVRHALDPAAPIVPYAMAVEERHGEWLAEREAQGANFTSEQRQWLGAIKDRIARSLRIDEGRLRARPSGPAPRRLRAGRLGLELAAVVVPFGRDLVDHDAIAGRGPHAGQVLQPGGGLRVWVGTTRGLVSTSNLPQAQGHRDRRPDLPSHSLNARRGISTASSCPLPRPGSGQDPASEGPALTTCRPASSPRAAPTRWTRRGRRADPG